MNLSRPPAHRPPLFRSLLAVLIGLATAQASAAPVPRAKTDPGENPRFLGELARAEQKHDYRSLLAECDRQIIARPADYECYRRRALARWGAREYDGARGDFARAVELARQQKAPARLLAIMIYGGALIYREAHDTAAEATELERAARADGSFTDALNDLAWIRATNPDAALRNGRHAVDLARRACQTVPGSVKYLDTLAAAYAEAGDARRAADAEKAAIKAARLDPAAAGEYGDFLAGAQGRVDLYAGGGHYREDPSGKPSGQAAQLPVVTDR